MFPFQFRAFIHDYPSTILLRLVFTLLSAGSRPIQLPLHGHTALLTLSDLHRARREVWREDTRSGSSHWSSRNHRRGQGLLNRTLIMLLRNGLRCLRPWATHTIGSNIVRNRRWWGWRCSAAVCGCLEVVIRYRVAVSIRWSGLKRRLSKVLRRGARKRSRLGRRRGFGWRVSSIVGIAVGWRRERGHRAVYYRRLARLRCRVRG
jgi:hypothetical protein